MMNHIDVERGEQEEMQLSMLLLAQEEEEKEVPRMQSNWCHPFLDLC